MQHLLLLGLWSDANHATRERVCYPWEGCTEPDSDFRSLCVNTSHATRKRICYPWEGCTECDSSIRHVDCSYVFASTLVMQLGKGGDSMGLPYTV